MLKIVPPDLYDTFAEEGNANAANVIRVPHYFGRMIISVVDAAKQGNSAVNKVALIKFAREWSADRYGKAAGWGLAEAKCIVDHYLDIGFMPNQNRDIMWQWQ